MSGAVPDRRPGNADSILKRLDNGEGMDGDEQAAAWLCRDISLSVKAGTSNLPVEFPRVVRALRGFLS